MAWSQHWPWQAMAKAVAVPMVMPVAVAALAAALVEMHFAKDEVIPEQGEPGKRL